MYSEMQTRQTRQTRHISDRSIDNLLTITDSYTNTRSSPRINSSAAYRVAAAAAAGKRLLTLINATSKNQARLYFFYMKTRVAY